MGDVPIEPYLFVMFLSAASINGTIGSYKEHGFSFKYRHVGCLELILENSGKTDDF